MATWEEFAAAEPTMAKVLRNLLGWIPIAYIATVRRDGAPRVHPFVPIFAADRMFIAIPDWSPKRHDLKNDGRFAMHALPGKRDDEFYMTGRASLIKDADTCKLVSQTAKQDVPKSDDIFELHADYVMTAHWENQGQPDTYAVRKEWHAVGAQRAAPNGAGPGRGNGRAKPRPKARAASGSRATRKGS